MSNYEKTLLLSIFGTFLFVQTALFGQVTTVNPILFVNQTSYNLEQNSPNPVQMNTKIGFYLPVAQFAELKLFSISGIEVTTLTNGEMAAGQHQINFSNYSYNLPSGVYYYTLKAGDFIETKLMTIGR